MYYSELKMTEELSKQVLKSVVNFLKLILIGLKEHGNFSRWQHQENSAVVFLGDLEERCFVEM